MSGGRGFDPHVTREAVLAIEPWLRDGSAAEPSRTEIGTAVRLTARALAALAPGASVEVRVPPFVAVQCIPGPRHTRGAPPNVVETDPRTWLLLVAGLISLDRAARDGRLVASGTRAAEIAPWFPLFRLGEEGNR